MVDKMVWNGKIETFEIHAKDLETAKKEMTGRWLGFKSRVIAVVSNGDHALITVETCGRFPFVRNKWNRFIVKPEEKRANGVQALEYMMEQKAKEAPKRGRPKTKGV
jgi:hypothetical protein